MGMVGLSHLSTRYTLCGCWRADFVSRETNGRCQSWSCRWIRLCVARQFAPLSSLPWGISSSVQLWRCHRWLHVYPRETLKSCRPLQLWTRKVGVSHPPEFSKIVQQWGFLSPSQSIRDEGGVGLSGAMTMEKSPVLKAAEAEETFWPHRIPSGIHPLIEMLSSSLWSMSWRCWGVSGDVATDVGRQETFRTSDTIALPSHQQN